MIMHLDSNNCIIERGNDHDSDDDYDGDVMTMKMMMVTYDSDDDGGPCLDYEKDELARPHKLDSQLQGQTKDDSWSRKMTVIIVM